MIARIRRLHAQPDVAFAADLAGIVALFVILFAALALPGAA